MTKTSISTVGQEEITAGAIRQALAQARSGRLAEASKTAEQALGRGGDSVALHALIGMLRCQAGAFEQAIAPLRAAHGAKPSDTLIASNLISALMQLGRNDEALGIASLGLARSDPTLRIARLRGFLAQLVGDASSAVEAYEIVIASDPRDWESWNNLGTARTLNGDSDGAIIALGEAAKLSPQAIPIRLNLARALRQARRLDEAESQLRSIADEDIENTEALANLHDLLKERGREDEGVLEVLERIVERDPANVKFLLALARQQFLMLQTEEPEGTFRRVLKVDASNSEAFIGLAVLYEHSRPAALEGLLEEAERRKIDPQALGLIRAFAHRRAKRHIEGLAAIESVPADFEVARREDMLGQFHDALGNYDAAFAAFTRMNEAQAEDPSQPVLRSANLRARIRDRLQKTTSGWISSWVAPPVEAQRTPVFLLGFPRSGTTLLDTMLMGHPDVAVMEERPPLSRVGTMLGGFDAIPQLTEAQIREGQELYFQKVREHIDLPADAMLIDKVPLHLNGAPMIHRLFPNAKFILALRHPADVVLSCFISNFRLNPSMSNFVRLDTTAEFYDLTFSNWENARRLLPLQVHPIHYENLIDDPEGQLRKVAEFLGLEWHEDVLDHQRTAANRGVITTASYAQVTQPIYKRSVKRWERYRHHLEPVLPLLQPWADKFGYTL